MLALLTSFRLWDRQYDVVVEVYLGSEDINFFGKFMPPTNESPRNNRFNRFNRINEAIHLVAQTPH